MNSPYEPPASRPSNGGIARAEKSRLWFGFGLGWADAAAAGLISFGILHDGIGQLRAASAELADGAPRKLEKDEIADEAQALKDALEQLFPGARVRLREAGRVIRAQVDARPPDLPVDLDALWPGDPERSWRLGAISFVAPDGSRE